MTPTQIHSTIPWLKRNLRYLDTSRDKWMVIISSGVFCALFLLYFKPFGITNYDPDFQIDGQFIMLISTVGLVTMIALVFTEFMLRPLLIKNWNYGNALVWFVAAMLFLSSTIFLYYNWLGAWHDWRFKSYLGFIPDVSFIGAFSVGVLVLYFEYKGAKSAYELSLNERAASTEKVRFHSENEKEQLVLDLDQLLYLVSEDNYVAIHFWNNAAVEKVLIRNSLKGIMDEVQSDWIVQCHRSYLVNLHQVIHVSGNNHGLELKLNHLRNYIPVSRKYVSEIRKVLGHLVIHP